MSEDRSGDPAIGSGSSGDRVDRLTRTIRDQTFPNVKPRDSATLILIDRGATVPKVLLGRRHERHKFMPGKFVFPGGRIEPTDRQMATSGSLHERHIARLMTRVKRPSAVKAASFALAAVRETYEETGLMVGVPSDEPILTPTGPWEAFAKAGIVPDLSAIHFIARAITPPNRSRRFDSRFSQPTSRRLRIAPTVSSGRMRNLSNWSGYRSPRRGGSICPASPRLRSRNCRTA